MVKLNILRPVGRCLYLIKAADEVLIYRPAVFTLHYEEITQLELDQPRQHSKEISPFNDNEKTANPSQGRRERETGKSKRNRCVFEGNYPPASGVTWITAHALPKQFNAGAHD